MNAYDLAQLRHAYAHLKAGTVGDMGEFADGLIAPVIRHLEAALTASEALPDTLAGVRNILAEMEREPEASELAQDGREGAALIIDAPGPQTPATGLLCGKQRGS